MTRPTYRLCCLTLTFAATWSASFTRAAEVLLKDTPGQHLDVLVDGKVAVRYMYAYDKSTPERLNETFKPYLHVFDADGKTPITKGPGGKYPHHRGISIGFNKIAVEGGKTYDRWHMKGGEIVHKRFRKQDAKDGQASFTADIAWYDDAGKQIVWETRTVAVRPAAAPARLVIDVRSKLAAKWVTATLGGDPEHAGVHFRASNDIDLDKTVYTYPRENADAHKDTGYPWVGMSFSLNGGGRYSVVQMTREREPKDLRWSAYRDYGRFGAFRPTEIDGSGANFDFRFVIADGEMLPVEAIQKIWDEWAGGSDAPPSAVPKTTVKPAEKPGAKTAPTPRAERLASNLSPSPGTPGEGRAEGLASSKGKDPQPNLLPGYRERGKEVATSQPTTAPANFKGHRSNPGPVDAPIVFDVPPPEPLKVAEALKTFALPEGLRIEPVASEPMVETPVAISFDERGRIYVCEMRSYMQNVDGDGEQDPIGRIKRLTDTDGDGRMDKAEVFLDGLVMPRAVLAVRGGVLVGEPPELAFWKDTNDDGKADKKTVVATDYGRRGGQPEHMANTPIVSLDNWVYSAGHTTRFRVNRGQWTSEPTRSRGQWGLAQDDYGRLYFSTNSDVARGDPLPSQYFSRNPFYKITSSQNVRLMMTQEVWPSHPTPGVNRGYTKGQLRDDGTLRTATAAGGSTVYRGGLLPGEFVGDLFTPEPSGNLIKRMKVADPGGKLTATNAYEGKDFLTSTDERFRPVFMCTGPDGALYVVDMYQGVLQHRYFLTHYLIKNIKRRELETPIRWGRVYRIVPDTASKDAVALPTDPKGWVEMLGHPNGWMRDTAQRVLVERNDRTIAPLVKKVATGGATSLGRLHALWTLEGMGRLDELTTRKALSDPDAKVRAAAVRLSEPLLAPGTRASFQPRLLKLATDPAPEVQLQLVLSMGGIPDPPVEELVANFLTNTSADPDLMRDAALSGLRGRELEFAERLLSRPDWTTESPARARTLTELARCVMNERRASRVGRLVELVAGEAEGSSWRQAALLAGMTPKVDPDAKGPAPVGKLIYLDAQPDGLASLLDSDDEWIRETAKRLDARLAWPGKPGVPPPPKIKPLTPAQQAQFARGREVYAATCAACHQPTGQGLEGLAPALVDSEWVLGPPGRAARVVLHGLTGPISVNGAPFNGEMPALSTLPDADIAAALTYIRREWEHTADPVDEATVAKVREATKDRADLWTARELMEPK